MQPNLKLIPPPSTTVPAAVFSFPRSAAYGLVFSLTIATTPTSAELYKRVTLPAFPLAGPHTTTSTSFIREAPLVAVASNPLEALIDEIHAEISEEVWARVPAIYAADIDKHVYGI